MIPDPVLVMSVDRLATEVFGLHPMSSELDTLSRSRFINSHTHSGATRPRAHECKLDTALDRRCAITSLIVWLTRTHMIVY